MAERRILRRNQVMQSKKRENPPVILEEDEHSYGSEKTIISKPKDATVEVTVKVKKRRDKSRDSAGKLIPLHDKEFRKGSWGDLLLSSSRASLNMKSDGRDKKPVKESYKDTRRINFNNDAAKPEGRFSDDDHSPLCQKIPLTSDLYLETHTHFKKSTVDHPDGDRGLLKENEELRKQLSRLKKEIEVSKVRSGDINNRLAPTKTTCTSTTSKVWNSDLRKNKNTSSIGGQTQGTQTSATCLLSPKKGTRTHASSVADSSRREAKKLSVETQVSTEPPEVMQLENTRLQNEELRQQIAKLLIDVNQTRSENCEFVGTIKELHQTADALTRANRELQEKHNLLILNHHGQQALQEQLLQIVTHNVQMKETLETLMSKQSSPTTIDDNQLAQFRNVIKDVKSTIAREMEGLTRFSSPPTLGFLVEKDVSNSAFNIADSSLNDTNASEIRRILGTQPPEIRRGRNVLEDRSSSTQYLNFDGFADLDSNHYRPSPLTVSKFSPRISTPNSFSNFSMSLSEAGATSFPQPAVKTTGPQQVDDEWRALEDEVSRTFIPVRNELSNYSTTSYSSGSSSSSPNPMMMRQ